MLQTASLSSNSEQWSSAFDSCSESFKRNVFSGEDTIKRCANCNKVELNRGQFKRCARCRVPAYCSVDCQKADWRSTHKAVCAAKPTSNDDKARQ